jgi:DNA-3-methyladenine glycosylase
MFGPPGHVYVYFTYGMHWCANLVCHTAGGSGAVLLRAGQIMDGVSMARARRPAARAERDLARGPARLATALGIDGAVNGLDLFSSGGGLTVRSGGPVLVRQLRTGPRVGVSGPGGTSPWRYWLDGDRTVSAYRPGRPARGAT